MLGSSICQFCAGKTLFRPGRPGFGCIASMTANKIPLPPTPDSGDPRFRRIFAIKE